MIVINPEQAGGSGNGVCQASVLGNIAELAIALVVKNDDAVGQADGQICASIIVIIRRGSGDCPLGREAGGA